MPGVPIPLRRDDYGRYWYLTEAEYNFSTGELKRYMSIHPVYPIDRTAARVTGIKE